MAQYILFVFSVLSISFTIAACAPGRPRTCPSPVITDEVMYNGRRRQPGRQLGSIFLNNSSTKARKWKPPARQKSILATPFFPPPDPSAKGSRRSLCTRTRHTSCNLRHFERIIFACARAGLSANSFSQKWTRGFEVVKKGNLVAVPRSPHRPPSRKRNSICL